jgi:AmpD protein
VRALGSTQEDAVDVRIVSATHKDLAADVQAGRFRQDLYLPAERHRDRGAAAARAARRPARAVPGAAGAHRAGVRHAGAALSPDVWSSLRAPAARQRARTREPAAPRRRAVRRPGAAGRRHRRRRAAAQGRPTARRPAARPAPACRRTCRATSTSRSARSWCKALQETGFNRTAAAQRLGLSLRQIRYRIERLAIAVPGGDDPDDAPSPPERRHDPLWSGGWYRFARRLDSPNFGPRPAGAQVDLVVVHSISLPPGEYGGDEVQRLFTNTLDWARTPISARSRTAGVGAFLRAARRRTVAVRQLRRPRLACGRNRSWRGRDNCNDDSVGIELEGLEGGPFEPAQYEALAAVCAALAQRYPMRHVAGHEHIAPGRKQDPGSGFDWALLRRQLGWEAAVSITLQTALRHATTTSSVLRPRGPLDIVVAPPRGAAHGTTSRHDRHAARPTGPPRMLPDQAQPSFALTHGPLAVDTASRTACQCTDNPLAVHSLCTRHPPVDHYL